VFVAHALIGLERASLFVVDGKVPAALAESLARDGIKVEPYAKAADALAALPNGQTLLIDPRRITFGLLQSVPAAVTIVESVNPSTFLKSRKTEAEAEYVPNFSRGSKARWAARRSPS
jgi:Xaa-Pro aminopeptidase